MRIRTRRMAGVAAAFALLFAPVREYAECAMRGSAEHGGTAELSLHAGHGGIAELQYHAEDAEPAEMSAGAESPPPAPRAPRETVVLQVVVPELPPAPPREPAVPTSEVPVHCPDAAGWAERHRLRSCPHLLCS